MSVDPKCNMSISRIDVIWIAFCGLVSSAVIVISASRLSATFDEPLYLQLGLTHWRTGSTHGLMRVGTMPLPVDANTLPVFVWERLRGQPFDAAADIGRILPVARLGTLLFWWPILILGWKLAHNISGPWAGRLAVGVLCCEPNLLAHAGLATTDIALVACLMVFCWLFQRGRPGTWWPRVGLPALGYAVALLAKASALAFVPLIALVLESSRLWQSLPDGRLLDRLRGTAAAIITRRNFFDSVVGSFIALVGVYIYCGSDWQAEPGFVDWANRLPEGLVGGAMRWFSQNLCIFNNAGVAFARQIKHNMQGHGVFLLGETAPRSFWYYFPVALSIKTPLPLLFAPMVLAIFRRRALGNVWLLVTAALLLFSLNCRVQIGVRLVMPIIVFGVIGLAAAWAKAHEITSSLRQRRLWIAGAAAGFGWLLFGAVQSGPDRLRYANEAWGGPDRIYQLLSDSNCDWGQGLHDLAIWQDRNNHKEICIWYFGGDPRVNRQPFVQMPLHQYPAATLSDLENRLQGRPLAVSKTLLYGGYKATPQQKEMVKWFRQMQPMAETGTFLIYDLTDRRIAAVSQD